MKRSANNQLRGQYSLLVYDDIKSKIIKKSYGVGDKIPSESELCQQFNVSRVTVRRATEALCQEGLIKRRRGDGMRVLKQKATKVTNKMISIMTLYNVNLVGKIQSYILSKGYMPCFFLQCDNEWDHQSERLFLMNVKDEFHAGLIAYLTPHQPLNTDLTAKIALNGTNVIHVGQYSQNLPKENYYLVDYYKAGHMAATALMLSGYKKIIFTHATEAPYNHLLRKGFRAALDEMNRSEDFENFLIPVNILNDKKNRKCAVDYFNRFKESIGVFATWKAISSDIFDLQKLYNKKIPDKMGLLSFDEAPLLRTNHIDALEYNQLDQMKTAVDLIIDSQPIKKMIVPKFIKKGTML